ARRWLPDAPAALDGAAAGPDRMAFTGEADAGPTAGARVLVADDNADMRSYLEGLLSPHWRVESVADGAMALERALASPPDLVLSDVMMPGLDGFGLLRALRADERTRHVPVVMLSARAGDRLHRSGGEAHPRRRGAPRAARAPERDGGDARRRPPGRLLVPRRLRAARGERGLSRPRRSRWLRPGRVGRVQRRRARHPAGDRRHLRALAVR